MQPARSVQGLGGVSPIAWGKSPGILANPR